MSFFKFFLFVDNFLDKKVVHYGHKKKLKKLGRGRGGGFRLFVSFFLVVDVLFRGWYLITCHGYVGTNYFQILVVIFSF